MANSQSHNPYSYIMNNPLAGTDPSGYLGCGTGALGKAECNDEQKHKRRDSGSVGFRAVETIWINGGPAASNGARHSPRSAATGERERGAIGGPRESDDDFVDNFIGNHLIHITEGATEDEDVEAPAPEEVRGALLTMAATKTGRALMQHFVSSGTKLKLVNTTNSRTVENGIISAGFMAFYGDDISGQDMAFYNLDVQGFRTTVSEKNPFMLDSVVNTMSLDVLLAAEMGHTRAENQFGINEINTYSEVVPHAEIENRYRAERGLPIRRSYKQKDGIKNYMEANN